MANNITVKDGGGNDQIVRTTETTGVHVPHHIVESLPVAWLVDFTGSVFPTITVAIAGAQTLATLTTLTGSGIAHDAADAGNPHKIGARAKSSLAAVTLVSADDRTDLFAGPDGVLLVRRWAPRGDAIRDRLTNTDGASTAFAGSFAAPGAGVRVNATQGAFSNTSPATITVDIRDGVGGSVLWTVPVPPGGCLEKWDPPLEFSDNTAAAIDASAATTTLTACLNGFKSKT